MVFSPSDSQVASRGGRPGHGPGGAGLGGADSPLAVGVGSPGGVAAAWRGWKGVGAAALARRALHALRLATVATGAVAGAGRWPGPAASAWLPGDAGDDVALGDGLLATRLPSLVGFGLGCVCLGLFVRRRVGLAGGTVALLVPSVTAGYDYAYEARPYGLLLGASGRGAGGAGRQPDARNLVGMGRRPWQRPWPSRSLCTTTPSCSWSRWRSVNC